VETKKLAQQILKLFLKWQAFFYLKLYLKKSNEIILNFMNYYSKETGLSFAEKQF
jgi:hypothetical protein